MLFFLAHNSPLEIAYNKGFFYFYPNQKRKKNAPGGKWL